MTTKPRKRGIQKLITVSPELDKQLDEFRFARRFKSEAGAIRELIVLGLDALKKQEQTSVKHAA